MHKNKEKLYYSIGEVAEMFNVNPSLIRFWEKEFDIIKPKKNKKGNRLFTPKDIENFNFIFHLVKEKGYTLKGAKKKIKSKSSDELKEKILLINTLKKLKLFLIELQNML